MNPLLIFGLLAGGAFLLFGRGAKAETHPAIPTGKRPAPANTGLPRRGPNGTVLASDLPVDCQYLLRNAVDSGFDETAADAWLVCIAELGLTSGDQVYNDL